MSEKLNQTFSKNLKKLMFEQNINQKKLADLLNVAPSSVSFWINGKTVPKISVLQKLTKVFNCNQSDLFFDESQISSNIVTKNDTSEQLKNNILSAIENNTTVLYIAAQLLSLNKNELLKIQEFILNLK